VPGRCGLTAFFLTHDNGRSRRHGGGRARGRGQRRLLRRRAAARRGTRSRSGWCRARRRRRSRRAAGFPARDRLPQGGRAGARTRAHRLAVVSDLVARHRSPARTCPRSFEMLRPGGTGGAVRARGRRSAAAGDPRDFPRLGTEPRGCVPTSSAPRSRPSWHASPTPTPRCSTCSGAARIALPIDARAARRRGRRATRASRASRRSAR